MLAKERKINIAIFWNIGLLWVSIGLEVFGITNRFVR